jgi:hypothetical protein
MEINLFLLFYMIVILGKALIIIIIALIRDYLLSIRPVTILFTIVL